MLEHEISYGCLANYLGFIFGLALLGLSVVVDVDLVARLGWAALLLACTYSVHRSVARQGDRMREAFDMGRDYERSRNVRTIH